MIYFVDLKENILFKILLNIKKILFKNKINFLILLKDNKLNGLKFRKYWKILKFIINKIQ